MSWWRDAVVYQIYPRSFADSDGDGIGDLAGIASRLDYLEWLGIDGVWLNPITPSPNVDWGYDVSDYTAVHPELGTLADLDRLVAEAGRRGIRVLLDLVPNHTSIEHRWFRERPEFYLWADEIPNNWRAMFGGGSAWTLDPERGRYYMHNFAAGQPDLDWWNEDVRAEFQRILRFWFDRGVAGFRIDVAHALVKDRLLRDDPPATPDDPAYIRRVGVKHVYSMNRPETHDILRGWRRIADSYEPPKLLLGEVYVLDVERWARYYGDGDELQLAFSIPLVHAPLGVEPMREIVAQTEAALPSGCIPCWTGSNHDAGRLASRWCGGDEELARCALVILLCLRGTPMLYYGDELALENGRVPPERVRDCAEPSRDPGRTPMPWTPGDGGWRDPWLPLEDTSRNVEVQRADPGSMLNFTQGLIALRRARAELREGSYEALSSPLETWVWRRGTGTIVAVNLGTGNAALDLEGELLLSTRVRNGWDGVLAAREAVVLDAAR
jgi:alpha-glucosidase